MYISIKISFNSFRGLRLKTFAALLLALVTSYESLAQLREDFSDGEFVSNPQWHGTTDDFAVNDAGQLQLAATTAGTSYLYLEFPAEDVTDFEWRFFVKQSFAPSGGNFSRFYLMSDQSDFRNPLNGYYLQFGEPGSLDAIELFRQSGSSAVSVCRAANGRIASAFALTAKVTRRRDGLWTLYVDYAGGTEFVEEAAGLDATYSMSRFSGVLCTYTITNATRFYFDNVQLKQLIVPDTLPPKLVSATAISASLVGVVFSESVDKGTAEDAANYYCRDLMAHPLLATLSPDRKSVQISFSERLTNGKEAALTVENIRDSSGNVMERAEVTFLYFEPAPIFFRDIIITELLPDPLPQVGLPASEFAELFNRSANPVQLAGWSFTDGSSVGKFPSYILLPGKYLIVCPSGAVDDYSRVGVTIALSNFPTLNNGGDSLRLVDENGAVIDSVDYSINWYADDDRLEGGWSLEMIDPENSCEQKTNWTTSESASGGTPGSQNSVYANKPDHTGPRLLSASPTDSVTVVARFDERLEQAVPGPDNFQINPAIAIKSVYFTDATLTSLTLSLAGKITASNSYTLTVENIFDCPGNKVDEAFSQTRFVLPEPAIRGDIVINEILPNPRPTGVDFVEVYNRSDKTINLQNWSIRNAETSASPTTVSADFSTFAPGEYKVFTPDASVLKGEYVAGVEENFSSVRLPPFNDDAGSVAIVDPAGHVIDSMRYNVEMQSPFLQDASGVSLERISPEAPSDASNWRSASSDAGFATPGYLNSNARTADPPVESIVVEPEILQPGIAPNDFALIRYHFDHGGFVANVRICDQQGRAIRNLVQNELLGTEGFFRWDGDVDGGGKARVGYYMVWFEIFNASGTLRTFRKRIAVF